MFQQSIAILLVDTETSGLSIENDFMTEYALYNPFTGASYSTLININKDTTDEPIKLSKRNINITGIHPDMLMKDGIGCKEAFTRFMEFVNIGNPERIVLIGHNIIKFDKPFLEKYFNMYNMDTSRFEYLDSYIILCKRYPKLKCHRLGYLKNVLGIELSFPLHRALADCKCLHKVLEKSNIYDYTIDELLLYCKS